MKSMFKHTALAALIGLSTPALAGLAYVSNEKDNTLSVIDTDTMEVVDTIDVGARPWGILLSRDYTKLYICASDDDTVQVMDLASRKIIDTLPSGMTRSSSRCTPTTVISILPTRTTTWLPCWTLRPKTCWLR